MLTSFIEELDISSFVDFFLCKGKSKKNGKLYHCICLKIDDTYFPIKFITDKQYEDIRKED